MQTILRTQIVRNIRITGPLSSVESSDWALNEPITLKAVTRDKTALDSSKLIYHSWCKFRRVGHVRQKKGTKDEVAEDRSFGRP
jgi:hypothetical protein